MVKSFRSFPSWLAVVVLLAGAAKGADQQAPHDRHVKFIVTSGETGKPIAGADIELKGNDEEFPYSRKPFVDAAARKFITDKDGVALATGLRSETYMVRICAANFARRRHRVHLTSAIPLETVEDQLDPGGIVRGVVVDESDKPVSGVNAVFSSDSAEFNWIGDAQYTDKDGKFQDSFAPLDIPIRISFWCDNFAHKEIRGNDRVVLSREKPVRELRVVLHRRPAGGSIVAKVTDPAGRPIGDVFATYTNADFATQATSDSNGRFRLDGLLVGETEVPDHVVVALRAQRYFYKTVVLTIGTAAHPSESTIMLEPAHTARGRIIDDRGQPIARAKIRLWDSHQSNILRGTYTANDDGSFAIDSLPRLTRFSIETPYGSDVKNVDIKLDTPQPITYTVESPGAITARVVDAETRKAVPQFHVWLNDSPEWLPEISMKRWLNGTGVHALDGRFTIQPISIHHPVELIVDADGYERNIVPRAVGHRASQAPELTVVLLPVKPQDYGKVEMRFVDDRGRGIPGVNLRLGVSTRASYGTDQQMAWQLTTGEVRECSWVEQYRSATADTDGRFEFTRIVSGRYLQLAYWGERVPTHLWTSVDRTARGKKQSITINVPRLTSLRVAIDRRTMPDAQMVYFGSIGPGDINREIMLAAKQTSFEFVDIAPGQYSLGVYSRPKLHRRPEALIERRITVSPGDNPQLQLTTPDKK